MLMLTAKYAWTVTERVNILIWTGGNMDKLQVNGASEG